MKVAAAPVAEVNFWVRDYLEKYRRVNRASFAKLVIDGYSASALLGYLNNPPEEERESFDYRKSLRYTIKKIYETRNIPFPPVQPATETEWNIESLLKHNGESVFKTTPFFFNPVTVSHVIQYLQRDETIYSWNADFLRCVQAEYRRAKDELIGE